MARKSMSAVRRDQVRVTTARTGAPTSMPTAKAEISSPAAGIETSRSADSSGSSPASINSDVP
jgi:hypothetical protein